MDENLFMFSKNHYEWQDVPKKIIDQIFLDFPYAEFSDDFRNGTVARLDRVNERYTSKLKPTKTDVTIDDVYKIVSEMTGVPITKLDSKETEKLLKMEEIL